MNAKVNKVEEGKMFVTEVNDKAEPVQEHTLLFKYSMMLPAFKGIDAINGVKVPIFPLILLFPKDPNRSGYFQSPRLHPHR